MAMFKLVLLFHDIDGLFLQQFTVSLHSVDYVVGDASDSAELH